MSIIKICGLQTKADMAAVAVAGANWAGFVFAPSRRKISVQAAVQLVNAGPPALQIVGLFDQPDDQLLADTLAHLRLTMLQLHGDVSPARMAAIKQQFQLPIIRAQGINGPEDLAQAALYHGIADYLLFDAKPPAGSTQQGGHGQTFDWSLLKNYTSPTPWLLAGGLTPTNVADAITRCRPHGVDVSSGVEKAGAKDAMLIADFCLHARQAFAETI